MNTQISAKAFVPEIITKELAVLRVGDHRKIRLSTNFLPLVGFEAGLRHSVEVLPNHGGIRLAFDANGPQKVYQRQYKSRRNNPFETVVEIGAQAVLDAAIPQYTERLHFTMRHGEILVRPLANRTFSIRRAMSSAADPFSAMVAMTSGIDARCLQDCGFQISAVLEYRPREARDQRDLTETGMLSVLANCAPRAVFNEDISTIDWRHVADALAAGPRIGVLHVSLQCDDFSSAKGTSFKRAAIENLTSSRDLVYDTLRMVETVEPASVVLEQVPGFHGSEEGMLFRSKMRKWGYSVTSAVLRGDDFGGLTRRERLYTVCSVYPDFQMPTPSKNSPSLLWPKIEFLLGECRDVSHTKALADGLTTGRARIITPESMCSPTVLKSQMRQAKDSIFIAMPDGRFLIPSLDLLQYLNGIPGNFDFNSVSGELRGEQIGQSVDVPMHEAVCRAVYEHIAANVGKHTLISMRKSRAQFALPFEELSNGNRL